MKTVLVVDDEPKIVQIARAYLEHAGFAVVSASDGKAALATARSSRPDLIVLDLGLPELDGLDVARALRRDSTIPIVMLTGRGDEADKIAGLEIGADDYVTKPFSPKELVARIRAVLRRTERPPDAGDVVRAGEVTLDVPRMRVRVGDRAVELTPTEFQLLAALARAPGRIFTRAQLLDAVHGVAFESYERAIDAHVKNIRRKLEPDPRVPRYLLTVYGVGYRFADDESCTMEPEERRGSCRALVAVSVSDRRGGRRTSHSHRPAASGRRMRGHFMRRFAVFVLLGLPVLRLRGRGVRHVAHQRAVLRAPARGSARSSPLGRDLRSLRRRDHRRVASAGSSVPLGDLIEAAESVEAGNYAVRVRARGPRELRSLARAFNSMSARLESSEEQRQQLAGGRHARAADPAHGRAGQSRGAARRRLSRRCGASGADPGRDARAVAPRG